MRFFFTIFFVLISNFLYAEDIKIKLHETKTLDQLVLERNSENNESNNNNNGNNDSEESFEEELIIEEESIIEKNDSSIENPTNNNL